MVLAQSSTHWCGLTCPNGYAQVINGTVGQCAPCSSSCKTCYYQDANKCSSCSSPNYLYQGACVAACPSGLFGSQLNRICVEACPVGTYPNQTSITDRDCVKCLSYCASCTGPNNNQCQSCQLGAALIGTTCVDTCPAGQYINGSSCVSCPSQCAVCTTPNLCSSCSKGAFLTGSSCVGTCPDGYYGDATSNKCSACNAICAKCTGSNNDQCTGCTNNLVLVGTTCQEKCLDGTFKN